MKFSVSNAGAIPPTCCPTCSIRSAAAITGPPATDSGLGLYIAQQIVCSHRGRIDVATRDGRFTVFEVVVPREHHSAPVRA